MLGRLVTRICVAVVCGTFKAGWVVAVTVLAGTAGADSEPRKMSSNSDRDIIR